MWWFWVPVALLGAVFEFLSTGNIDCVEMWVGGMLLLWAVSTIADLQTRLETIEDQPDKLPRLEAKLATDKAAINERLDDDFTSLKSELDDRFSRLRDDLNGLRDRSSDLRDGLRDGLSGLRDRLSSAQEQLWKIDYRLGPKGSLSYTG